VPSLRSPASRPFLIDHQLNPAVAKALREADWNVRTVTELFNVSPQQKITDQEIIPRCAADGLTWVTADIRARAQHRRLLREHLVSVLFVRRPPTGMNSRYELALLANAIRHFDICLEQEKGSVLQCRVGWGLPSPIEVLERIRRD